MNQQSSQGLLLKFSMGRPTLTNLEEINAALASYGSRIWPLGLHHAPENIRAYLRQGYLQEQEAEQICSHFLLSRERILAIIAEAGRTPQVPGGGELSTLDLTHDVRYPELYVVIPGIDYSRFDRFHVNTADDRSGVDEVMQVLSGGGVQLLQKFPGEDLVTLEIECVEPDNGWIITYSGAYPHIGSISGAREGTKVLMQIIGPESWQMRYEDGT